MKKTEIMNKLTRTFNNVSFKAKKHAPEALIVAGVAGVVTSAVMACKATTKLDGILEDTKNKVEFIHKASEEGNVKGVEYTPEDGKKDLTIVYTQTAVKLAKMYAPAVIVGALSLTAIITSHNILKKRNIALAAAYTTIDKSFKQYRNRVIDKFGKDLDRELRFNTHLEEVEEKTVDADGNETVEKKTIEVADPNNYSDYARIFDDGNPGWVKNAEDNLVYLRQEQSYFNKLLQIRGHVFLNEVYDRLGFPMTKAGNIVGWVYDEEEPMGDNFIDFGIYDKDNERARAFVNGYERSIVLDFNVDGNILELMN